MMHICMREKSLANLLNVSFQHEELVTLSDQCCYCRQSKCPVGFVNTSLRAAIWGRLFKAVLSRFSTWRICSREQAKSECDWLVMSSVFVTSQSSCFFLCSREQIRQVEKPALETSRLTFTANGKL